MPQEAVGDVRNPETFRQIRGWGGTEMHCSERQTSHGNPHRSAKTCVWHLSS